jgi:hypothetical protein
MIATEDTTPGIKSKIWRNENENEQSGGTHPMRTRRSESEQFTPASTMK